MAAYMWVKSSEDILPKSWGVFDDSKSTFEEWRLRTLKPYEDFGEAIVNFKRWPLQKLLKWHCPPAIAGTFVSLHLREVLRKFADEEELTFYPVTSICKDGINKDYQYLAPRHKVSCIDFERSAPKIDSSIDSLFHVKFDQTIFFRENCLGNKHIAWEAHLPMKIVVSETLREAVLELKDPGIEFVLPESYRWL